jgi:colanic acid/amylovoran biosynthesis glycosyltransferase
MPKIVLVINDFPKLSESFILNKFLGLLTRGWDVHVVCWKSRSEEWSIAPKTVNRPAIRKRVHVNWLQHPRGLALLLLPFAIIRCVFLSPYVTLRYIKRGWKHFRMNIYRKLYLDAELILLHPDVIHFEFGALAAERMYLKDCLGCKVVVSFRGYDLNFVGLADPEHYSRVWEHADALHLLGQDLWMRAQRRGCPPDKTHVFIPPGIDIEIFSPPERVVSLQVGTGERPLRILSVGRLEWKKGYEYAFEAIRLLAAKGVTCEYRIIGDGDYFEACSFTIHQMGLSDVVNLLGARSSEEVKAQMAWADIFFHPAVSEGFCNAVVEAQAMELPVVCSDAGGLPENVQDGLTGFVVERRNPSLLAKKIIQLAGDAQLRAKMGIAGRSRVQSKFVLENQTRAFEQLYSSVFATGNPSE